MGGKLKTDTLGDLRKNPSLTTEIGIGKDFLESMSKSLRTFKETMLKYTDALNKSLEKIKNENPTFIKNDWYLSTEYWQDFYLNELYTDDDIELEKKILKKFDKDIKNIKKRIFESNAERIEIIEELFTLYSHKHYYSTINLAYSIVDGISNKKFQTSFWGWEGDDKTGFLRTQKIKNKAENDSVFNFIEKRLDHRGTINAKSDKISKEDKISSNNRHLVVHGASFLYGNKANAVKSILLVEFISSLKINPNS